MYNWGGGGGYIAGGDSAGQSYANVLNNYFIKGPSTTIAPFTRGNENFHGCMNPPDFGVRMPCLPFPVLLSNKY